MRRAALPVTFTNLLHHVATGRADYKVRKASFGKYFRLRLDDVEYLVAEGAQELLRVAGPMPRIIREARYFSMPSADVGVEVLRNRALNC